MSTKPFFSILIPDAEGNIIDEVPVDVSPSRRYRYGADVTEFAIEDGSSGSEHRKKRPDEIEIDGMVSGSPLDADPTVKAGLRGDSDNQAMGSAPIPMQSAHDLLFSIHDKHTVVDIVDEYRYHHSMMMTSFEFEKSKATGLAFDFHLVFKALKIVTTAAGALPASMLKKLSQKRNAKKSDAAFKRQIQTSLKNVKGKVSASEASQKQTDYADTTRKASGM